MDLININEKNSINDINLQELYCVIDFLEEIGNLIKENNAEYLLFTNDYSKNNRNIFTLKVSYKPTIIKTEVNNNIIIHLNKINKIYNNYKSRSSHPKDYKENAYQFLNILVFNNIDENSFISNLPIFFHDTNLIDIYNHRESYKLDINISKNKNKTNVSTYKI